MQHKDLHVSRSSQSFAHFIFLHISGWGRWAMGPKKKNLLCAVMCWIHFISPIIFYVNHSFLNFHDLSVFDRTLHITNVTDMEN